jgi:hypothetical protein
MLQLDFTSFNLDCISLILTSQADFSEISSVFTLDASNLASESSSSKQAKDCSREAIFVLVSSDLRWLFLIDRNKKLMYHLFALEMHIC